MQLSKKTLGLLEKAGWYQGRNIDISEYERSLTDDGYIMTETAREFLRSFGGLTVIHPHAKVANYDDRFHLNPLIAIPEVCRERIETYFERVGEKLIVIGHAYREGMILTISESGRIFASRDELLVKLGDNYKEAFETLCEGRKTINID